MARSILDFLMMNQQPDQQDLVPQYVPTPMTGKEKGLTALATLAGLLGGIQRERSGSRYKTRFDIGQGIGGGVQGLLGGLQLPKQRRAGEEASFQQDIVNERQAREEQAKRQFEGGLPALGSEVSGGKVSTRSQGSASVDYPNQSLAKQYFGLPVGKVVEIPGGGRIIGTGEAFEPNIIMPGQEGGRTSSEPYEGDVRFVQGFGPSDLKLIYHNHQWVEDKRVQNFAAGKLANETLDKDIKDIEKELIFQQEKLIKGAESGDRRAAREQRVEDLQRQLAAKRAEQTGVEPGMGPVNPNQPSKFGRSANLYENVE